MKIYFVLVRFSSVSLMTALLDNLIFYLVWKRTGHILGAQVMARLASVVFNYSMVRARFSPPGSPPGAAAQVLLLV